MSNQQTYLSAAERAKQLYERGFSRPAIDILEAELASRPDDGRLWRLRAILLAREGRLDEAFDNIQRALSLVPLGFEGLLVLAGGYARRGKIELAEALCLDLAADNRFPADLWEPLYALLAAVQQWQIGLQVCLRALRERPDDDLLCFAAAQAMKRAGRPPEQVAVMLRKSVEINPGEPRYRASLAVHLMTMRRVREADAVLKRLTAAEIDSLQCRCCLSKLLHLAIQQGDGQRSAAIAHRLAELPHCSAHKRNGDQQK